jgi:hypothetical protein
LLHGLKLLVFLISLADTRSIRDNSCVQALQGAVEVLLVGLSVAVEVALLVGLHVGWDKDPVLANVTSGGSLSVEALSDGLKASEPLDRGLVDVLVLELWGQNHVDLPLLGDLLLVHLHLLLLLLDTDVDAVHQDVFVDDVG